MSGLYSGKIYLVDGMRTPFGKFGGSLKSITPVDLAVHCSKTLLEKSKLSPDKINQVIFGNVVPSTTDTGYAGRHTALKLGMPESTPGYTVNRLCGSGVQAIWDAMNLIKLGEGECFLACGSENMSLIPHLVYGSRFGTKYGALKTVDMLLDSLTDSFCQTPMGITAENLGRKFSVTREECDEFSMKSHEKASKAYADGHLQGEIAPIELKRGVCEKDEHIRENVSLEDMAKLPSTFKKDGLVTAGSASGIVDGAASVLVATEEFVAANNLEPLAEIVSTVVVGVDPTIMGIGPSPAIKKLLEKNNLKLDDIDLVEINEAFAAQALACQKDLELPSEKLNIWGGAVAIGHPLGATGTRISLTLARQLKSLNKNIGIASACIGGGQGIATLLKRP